MHSLYSEEERRRITELYAHMADAELEAIGADSGELTDIARHALEDEIPRRGGLKTDATDLASVPGRDAVELADVVSIRQFRDLPEALLAKGALDSAGIESFLIDDNIVRMDWFISNLVGGIKLCVKQDDADAALDLLEQSIPEEFEVEGVGRYEQPRLNGTRKAEMITPALKTRPVQINRAICLLCLSLTIGTLWAVIVLWDTWRSIEVPDVAVFLAVGITTFAVLSAFLIWKVAQGRNWARITLLIFFVIGLWQYPSSLRYNFHRSPVLAILYVTETAIEIYALLLVFTTPGRGWFSRPN
jgi:hypothetical protein